MTRLVVLLVLALTACEHGVDVEGTVTVSVDTQRLYSATAQGVVEIAAVSDDGTVFLSYRLATLCEPGAAPLVIPFNLFDFGCAEDSTLSVWAAPPSADVPATGCGVAESYSGRTKPADVDASEDLRVFLGTSGGSCSNGSARNLRLDL